MSQQTDQLIQLVHSLTKAEKRSFRLFAQKNNSAGDQLYMQLFDYIDAVKNYNEQQLMKKIPQIKKSQLSNIKANLTKQILSNLRLLYKNDSAEMTIRELLDFTTILQNKGMTTAALDVLDKARKLAKSHHETLLKYVVLDTERKIETHFITGSSSQKAYDINQASAQLLKKVNLLDKLSNLSIMIYGMYLKYGYVRNQRDFEQVRDFFYSNLPEINIPKAGFYEKIYYFQSCVWYYHMTQDFLQYYKYSQKWVDTFASTPHKVQDEPILYIKGLHNALNALYMANKTEKFNQYFELYKDFGHEMITSNAISHTSFYYLFLYTHQLNGIFLSGNYDEGAKSLNDLVQALESNIYLWDENRLMVFYYKLGCVYFGADNFDAALTFLNKLNNSPIQGLRQDIQCFARILTLISHYELKNEFLIRYQIKSVYRFLMKMNELQAVQKEILSFIRRTPEMNRKDLMSEFKTLRSKLVRYQDDPFEKRPFLYLDIISWLDSKINGQRIQDVIRVKMSQ